MEKGMTVVLKIVCLVPEMIYHWVDCIIFQQC